MVGTGVATAARTAVAVLAGAVALGLAAGMAVGPGMDTAQAAPHSPNPPNSWGTLYGDPRRPRRSGATSSTTTTACRWPSPTWSVNCAVSRPSMPSSRSRIRPQRHHSGPYTIPEKQKHGDGTSLNDEPVSRHLRTVRRWHHQGQGRKNRSAPPMDHCNKLLAKGRKVIAGVNAEVIWREPVKNTSKDGEPEANHPRGGDRCGHRQRPGASQRQRQQKRPRRNGPSTSSSGRGTAAASK